MNYGLYLSAAAMQVNMNRQNVFANNLANVETAGFRRDLAMASQRAVEVKENAHPADLANKLMDRLGGGLWAGPVVIDTSEGALQQSGNPLDLALRGDGFFAVRVPGADGAEAKEMMTRDGRFSVDGTSGRLVTTTGGHTVLSDKGTPITLNSNLQAHVDDHGQIWQGGEQVAALKIVRPVDAAKLEHAGEGKYTVSDGRVVAATAIVKQGSVERSNVDPIKELMNITSAAQAVSSAGNMMRYHDLLMDKAVNVLGRVA